MNSLKSETNKEVLVTTDWQAVPTLHNRVGKVVGSRSVGLSEATESHEYLVEFTDSVKFWIERRYLNHVSR